MRHSPKHAVTDERVVRRLIAENPWATIVSQNEGDIVASHYPVLLEDSSEELAVLTHVGRPDEEVHRLGTSEVLLIFAGPHGYISPSWYTRHATPAPTWNFSVAHCYGTPEVLDPEENLRVLTRLVDHFEQHVEAPVHLDQQFGARLSRGTVGIRIAITRFIPRGRHGACAGVVDRDPLGEPSDPDHHHLGTDERRAAGLVATPQAHLASARR